MEKMIKHVIDQEMRQSVSFFETIAVQIEKLHEEKDHSEGTNQLVGSMIEDASAGGVQDLETFHLIDAMTFQ
jgi:hypothetical protein